MSKALAQSLLKGKKTVTDPKVYAQIINEDPTPGLYLVVYQAIVEEIADLKIFAVELMRNISQPFHLLFLAWILRKDPDLANRYIRYKDPQGNSIAIISLEYALRKVRNSTQLNSQQKQGYSQLLQSLFIQAGADLNNLVEKPLQENTNATLFIEARSLARLYPPRNWPDTVNRANCIYLDRLDIPCPSEKSIELIRRRANARMRKKMAKMTLRQLEALIPHCLVWYNWTILDYIILRGATVNFARINSFLGQLLPLKEKSPYVYYYGQQMLFSLLDAGLHWDQSQQQLITELDMEWAHQIEQHYAKPQWCKICSLVQDDNKQSIPHGLRKLLTELNLSTQTDLDQACAKLRTLEQLDPDQLRQKIIDHNQKRWSQLDHLPSEATVQCANCDHLVVDPFTQGDLIASAYRDADDRLMCYPADVFPKLLETGKDPVTGTPLPKEFLQEIAGKQSQLSKLGILPPRAAKLNIAALGGFDQAWSDLQEDARINSSTSNQIQALFKTIWETEFGAETPLPQWTPAKFKFLQELTLVDLNPLWNSSYDSGNQLAQISAQYIMIKIVSQLPHKARNLLKQFKNLKGGIDKPYDKARLFKDLI